MAKRSGRGSRRAPVRYTLGGVQWPTTDISTLGVALVVVSELHVERHGQLTVERIRGNVHIFNSDTDATGGGVQVAAKILLVELDDAGAVTGDHSGIDTHEEDIAVRHLWMQNVRCSANAVADEFRDGGYNLEVDVKVRIKISSPKQALLLFMASNVSNRGQSCGYLRSLLRVG